ncbi:MAG: 2,3-bisphosphoglycerate-independent phosphoglycerate mutase, partial [Lacipirellulaceae bacterium]
MDAQALVRQLRTENGSKIVLYVADGLGGLPQKPGGLTELETARTPNLDKLAAEGVLGLSIPVAPGIAPGSGPGHLGLFGYDPVEYLIGRGALEATGIGFALRDGDVAIRANFCTVDGAGNITDRRAGRIPSEESAPLAVKLRQVKLPGVELFVEPVQEHRFVVVLRGAGLGGNVHDTDPQATGVPPLDPVAVQPAAVDAASAQTAELLKEFVRQTRELLKDEEKANCCTLRGITGKPAIPSFADVYGLRGAAIAVYPMYKGLASLVGMDVVGDCHSLDEQVETLAKIWGDYDFFFVHFKYTDSTGEDGNFD